ncbi:hypothetical protein CPB83DRAFT_853401 [Crepidotus variabilis]|uniref:Secreted protein n=1 Tax=Crepidotus variabilis TaxID=179855 RepID=A0A9P6JQ71_9AGAR|nr:hypothetical protein CPB83DRAFT_853401 [Crepidotus variabilis]
MRVLLTLTLTLRPRVGWPFEAPPVFDGEADEEEGPFRPEDEDTGPTPPPPLPAATAPALAPATPGGETPVEDALGCTVKLVLRGN